MKVTLYTDGAARGNPDGPGGYGAVLQFIDKNGTLHEKELSAGYVRTTNNRMELTAVIEGLNALTRPCEVTVHSDSQYVIKGFTEWLPGWRRRGWRNSTGKPVENQELWEALHTAVHRHPKVSWVWVRGHAGHPENERADALAVAAIPR